MWLLNSLPQNASGSKWGDICEILDDKERIQWFVSKQANARDVFLIGRGLDYAISLEGSLKMKEISYIHSEAYAAGELKHGTISLIEDGTLVIGVLTQSELYEKTISNMVECRSRGAYLMGLTTYGNLEKQFDLCYSVYIQRERSGGEDDMTKADRNLLDYIVVCISEFANRYGMHMRDAYIYLNRYKGIEFLKEFYDVEHTLSFDDTMDDLSAICRKNGAA